MFVKNCKFFRRRCKKRKNRQFSRKLGQGSVFTLRECAQSIFRIKLPPIGSFLRKKIFSPKYSDNPIPRPILYHAPSPKVRYHAPQNGNFFGGRGIRFSGRGRGNGLLRGRGNGILRFPMLFHRLVK